MYVLCMFVISMRCVSRTDGQLAGRLAGQGRDL